MTGHVRRPSEEGQAMVEFSLGSLALFAVLFALMLLGHTFGKQLDLQGANRSAARRAAVQHDNPDAHVVARQVLYDQLVLTRDSDVQFDIDPPPPWEHGQEIRVRARTPHQLSLLGLVAWSGTMESETRIRVE